jgi:Cof subfamily protein (haloacid dehalogenase superfamily)
LNVRAPSSAKPRLIAVDLDGTLLNPQGIPHARDVRALKSLQTAGVVVTIITGRMYSGTRNAAEIVGIRGPVGCVDGSHVVSASTHETLFHKGFATSHAGALRDSFAASGPATFLFSGNAIVHDDAGEPYLEYVATWSPDITRTSSVVDHHLWDHEAGITAVVAVGSHEQIQGAAARIQAGVGEHAQVATFPTRPMGASAGCWGMIVRASGGDKGTALAWIASHHGIAIEETVTVGDWVNDVPMLRAAGRSYAMGQAPDLVKESVTHILDETPLTGGGVASAARHAFGIAVG